MKPGVRARYWSKFKSRKKHYDAGKYQLKKGDEEESDIGQSSLPTEMRRSSGLMRFHKWNY